MLKDSFKNNNILLGVLFFLYFFLLLLGVLIPIFRLGTSSGFSVAFIYRSVIFTLFFVTVLFLYYKRYHSVNYILAIFMGVFFITNILAIFIPHNNVNISLSERLMATLYLISVIFTIFAFIEVLPSYITKESLLVLFFLVIITVLICALYSDIFEFKDIIAAFTAKGEDAHFHQIHSFFDNKNSYGLMLFVAIVANIYLYLSLRKKWLFIPMVYLFLNLIISRSKTGLLILIAAIIMIVIYYFFKSFKNHMVRNILILSIVIFLLYFGILIIYSEAIYSSSSFLSNLSNYVREAFIGQGIRSLQDRWNNIVQAQSIFTTPRIIIGYGEHTCYAYANGCCFSLGYIDSAYLYNLLAGGIFKTALFVYCYYLIFRNIHHINKNKEVPLINKLIMTLGIISILLYGLMENYQIIGSNHVSFIFLILSFSIPVLALKQYDIK